MLSITWSIIPVNVFALGAVLPPLMFARIEPSATDAKEIVPVDVIGPPVKPAPVATDVTAVAHCGFADAPCVCRKKPDVPVANADHVDAPR